MNDPGAFRTRRHLALAMCVALLPWAGALWFLWLVLAGR